MGGVTSGQFCLADSRCRAALNLDGVPQYGKMIDDRMKKPFLMAYSERPGRLGASDPIYARSASPYYRVDVKRSSHLTFSDMPFWPGGGLRARGAYGAIEPAKAVMVTRTIVREFFEMTLLKKPSPLLGGEALMPDITVRPPARN
jgi:hypothetical protein